MHQYIKKKFLLIYSWILEPLVTFKKKCHISQEFGCVKFYLLAYSFRVDGETKISDFLIEKLTYCHAEFDD